MQKKCKAGTASAVNYRVDQYNNEPLPYIKRNIRHNKKEEQTLKVYKHITQKGEKQIGLLAELFCKFYNKSTDWKDIVITNLHAIIASAVGRAEYLTFLPLYFFFWFVKNQIIYFQIIQTKMQQGTIYIHQYRLPKKSKRIFHRRNILNSSII